MRDDNVGLDSKIHLHSTDVLPPMGRHRYKMEAKSPIMIFESTNFMAAGMFARSGWTDEAINTHTHTHTHTHNTVTSIPVGGTFYGTLHRVETGVRRECAASTCCRRRRVASWRSENCAIFCCARAASVAGDAAAGDTDVGGGGGGGVPAV